jgi:hypothetical protein
MSYLNITEVESALVGLAAAYPSICELITLPNASIEGRTTHAVRIGTAPATSRDGVLLTGGVHAREWGSSEICVSLAADLCEAFTNHTGLAYGVAIATQQKVGETTTASVSTSIAITTSCGTSQICSPPAQR